MAQTVLKRWEVDGTGRLRSSQVKETDWTSITVVAGRVVAEHRLSIDDGFALRNKDLETVLLRDKSSRKDDKYPGRTLCRRRMSCLREKEREKSARAIIVRKTVVGR